VEVLRAVKAFAKAAGGAAKALEVLEALPDLPLPVIADYLQVLADE
jgi:hypothetical protein